MSVRYSSLPGCQTPGREVPCLAPAGRLPSHACFAAGLRPGTSPTSQGASLLLCTAALGLCSFSDGQAISEIMMVCRQRGGEIWHLAPTVPFYFQRFYSWGSSVPSPPPSWVPSCCCCHLLLTPHLLAAFPGAHSGWQGPGMFAPM